MISLLKLLLALRSWKANSLVTFSLDSFSSSWKNDVISDMMEMRNEGRDPVVHVKYQLVYSQACYLVQITAREKSSTRVVESLVDDKVQPWDVYPGGV